MKSIFAGAIMFGLIIFGLGVSVGYLSNNSSAQKLNIGHQPQHIPVVETLPALVSGLPDFSAIAERASPGVVHIRVFQENRKNYGPSSDIIEFLHRFGFPLPPEFIPPQLRTPNEGEPRVAHGVGSGFIWLSEGLLITNAHVVKDALRVEVTLDFGDVVQAKILGVDERTDVALLQMNLTADQRARIKPLTIGTSNNLRVGQWVVAIGSPFGLDKTVTAGIVSAKQRETGDFLPLIQTDVAINPGNSGGPLLNLAGEVVGMNSQIYSHSGRFQGISFALPIDEVITVAKTLKTKGIVERGRIGVLIVPVAEDQRDILGLKPNQSGLLIQGVENQGAAAKAGLLPGDVILSWNGKKVGSAVDLSRQVAGVKPGDKIEARILRNKSERTVTIKVASTNKQNQTYRMSTPVLD